MHAHTTYWHTQFFWSTVVYKYIMIAAKAYMISTGIRPNVATESQYTYMIMLRRNLLFFNRNDNVVGIAPGSAAPSRTLELAK